MMGRFQVLQHSYQRLIQLKQYVVLGVVGFLGLGILGTWVGVKLSGRSAVASDSSVLKGKSQKRIPIETSSKTLKPEEVWVDRLEKERDVMTKRLLELEKLVQQMTGQLLTMGGKGVAASSVISQGGNTLDSSFLKTPETGSLEPQPIPSVSSLPFSKTPVLPDKPKYHRISFQLDPRGSKKIQRSIDHYVPAGSFVRGVLTSGVVASTSVQASSNPQPIHIQLTDLGNLPRRFRSDVKQCFLIGSAYGDLASERVFMRLEKFSCIERKTQEIIELSVDGYVAGEDGANGLRGIVVDRSGPAMRNAFVGGFFAGLGNFFGQQKAQTPTTIGPNGVASLNTLSAQHMLEAGAGKGVGNAMEKFADFYIKRAEQLQPVLEIEPGRRVDVVFKAGFDMNQTVYRQTMMNNHDTERRQVAFQPSETSLSRDGVLS
jgi:conjugal transfer pilus assembly protein TraB